MALLEIATKVPPSNANVGPEKEVIVQPTADGPQPAGKLAVVLGSSNLIVELPDPRLARLTASILF